MIENGTLNWGQIENILEQNINASFWVGGILHQGCLHRREISEEIDYLDSTLLKINN